MINSVVSKKTELRNEWFGIVDGDHTRSAISELGHETERKWEVFQWLVIQFISNSEILAMQKLALSINDSNQKHFFIGTTA